MGGCAEEIVDVRRKAWGEKVQLLLGHLENQVIQNSYGMTEEGTLGKGLKAAQMNQHARREKLKGIPKEIKGIVSSHNKRLIRKRRTRK